jgi:hypothetical protein
MAERLTTITFAARHKTKLTVCSFPFPCCFQVSTLNRLVYTELLMAQGSCIILIVC